MTTRYVNAERMPFTTDYYMGVSLKSWSGTGFISLKLLDNPHRIMAELERGKNLFKIMPDSITANLKEKLRTPEYDEKIPSFSDIMLLQFRSMDELIFNGQRFNGESRLIQPYFCLGNQIGYTRKLADISQKYRIVPLKPEQLITKEIVQTRDLIKQRR